MTVSPKAWLMVTGNSSLLVSCGVLVASGVVSPVEHAARVSARTAAAVPGMARFSVVICVLSRVGSRYGVDTVVGVSAGWWVGAVVAGRCAGGPGTISGVAVTGSLMTTASRVNASWTVVA